MNNVEMGLAFLEGLALIVSPCILPVLPLVLAASVDGGKQRPYGIIVGFVLAFSLFAVLARKLVLWLGIDVELIKQGSLLLLALFGLVLLSHKLSEKFSGLTQGAANVGQQLANTNGTGFGSGVLIGALIGMVWTPCAGPILAAVLVQVIRQQSDWSGYAIIVSFALGAGVPMLLIALSGRKLVQKMGFFLRHAEAVRRVFGVLILLAVAYMASGWNVASLLDKPQVASNQTAQQLNKGLAQPYVAPELTGIEAWLNANPQTLQQLKGKVVLIDFWTYSCVNCIRTLPYITAWDAKYRDQGLVVIGIHAPEFEFEKKRSNVAAAIQQYGIRYPVALDNNFATWDAFKNQYWPAHYLIDRDGKVVYTHFGEGGYDVTENNIRYLLGLAAQSNLPKAETHTAGKTPETYLGHKKAQNFVGAIQQDVSAKYQFPAQLQSKQWALSGSWMIDAEKIVSQHADAALRLNFYARKVFLVMGSNSGKAIKVQVKLNGVLQQTITVQANTLYPLLSLPQAENAVLELECEDAGLEAYAFTFG